MQKYRTGEQMVAMREDLRKHLEAGETIKAFSMKYGINDRRTYTLVSDLGYRMRYITDAEFAKIRKQRS